MNTLYRLIRPEKQTIPLLINVPHASEYIPEAIQSTMTAPLELCKRDLDLYVDQIWADAPLYGATLMVANVSRYVVDLNRAADDNSPETVEGGSIKEIPGYYGSRGVVWRTTTEGTPVRPRPLTAQEFDERIATYHTPYHDALQEECDRIKSLFGYVILIDGHSMPSQGRLDHPDSGSRRADVVPGNVLGTSCHDSITKTVEDHFKDASYTVSTNVPYMGAWDTRHYGQPQLHQHAIQIELNRANYMNEKTFELDQPGIKILSETCCSLLPKLAALNLT